MVFSTNKFINIEFVCIAEEMICRFADTCGYFLSGQKFIIYFVEIVLLRVVVSRDGFRLSLVFLPLLPFKFIVLSKVLIEEMWKLSEL